MHETEFVDTSAEFRLKMFSCLRVFRRRKRIEPEMDNSASDDLFAIGFNGFPLDQQ